MITDRIGQPINPGDFIVYVTKTEAPSLQFAWVQNIVEKQDSYTNRRKFNIKLIHAEPDGTKKNKIVWEYNSATQEGNYRDTGTLSRSTLQFVVYNDSTQDNRLMKIRPI